MLANDSLRNLVSPGFDLEKANTIQSALNATLKAKETTNSLDVWQSLKSILVDHHAPFHIHLALFKELFPTWPDAPDAAPVWVPDEKTQKNAPLSHFMKAHDLNTVADCHAFSTRDDQAFWKSMITQLGIVFETPPERILNCEAGSTAPEWLPGARFNIADSCFQAPADAFALYDDDGQHHTKAVTVGELNRLSNRVANGLVDAGFQPGDRIAIIMPMNTWAVALYLGIIKMGGVVVSIADSFSSEEIATRLTIANARLVFTQDQFLRNGKALPLYPKVKAAGDTRVIVLPYSETYSLSLHPDDIRFTDFLPEFDSFTSVKVASMQPMHILFSSGTTGTPKAIAWNHTTAIKVASDALLHQGVSAGDVLCWPTNLGWMMGPWLIFAALINRASIALYPDVPKSRDFGLFVERASVTILGVVSTLVSTWRQSRCMEGLDWSSIKAFSSTGECSNPEDMFYLMWLANYKPVIEYCGGTEIGGAYLSSTLLQPNYASLFSTPAFGNRLAILSPEGHDADTGEVSLFPPAMGLSVSLENADHYRVYYEGMPTRDGRTLRRHGDQIKMYPNGYYSIQGRVDDTMNLGGIKVSAAEIERVLTGIPGIHEVAAIASSKQLGRSELVIFAATSNAPNSAETLKLMQQRINEHLNPLFKIHEVVFVAELPKTASQKIMRRELRSNYLTSQA